MFKTVLVSVDVSLPEETRKILKAARTLIARIKNGKAERVKVQGSTLAKGRGSLGQLLDDRLTVACADDAKSTGVGNRRCQLCIRCPSHPALEYGMLNAQQLEPAPTLDSADLTDADVA
mgnify:CR=1 FL=1